MEEMKGSKGREVSKTFSPLTEVQGVWRSAGLSFIFQLQRESSISLPLVLLLCQGQKCHKMPQDASGGTALPPDSSVSPFYLCCLSFSDSGIIPLSLPTDYHPRERRPWYTDGGCH